MKSLNLIVLRCRDLESSRAFYEMLGMKFTRHSHSGGPEHYAHEDDRGVFELYPQREPSTGDATGLGFFARDLGALYKSLDSAAFAPGVIKRND